jgi:hypothetical protein
MQRSVAANEIHVIKTKDAMTQKTVLIDYRGDC